MISPSLRSEITSLNADHSVQSYASCLCINTSRISLRDWLNNLFNPIKVLKCSMASPLLSFVACTVFESNRTALPRAVKHINAKTLSCLSVDEFGGPLVDRGVARDLQVRSP